MLNAGARGDTGPSPDHGHAHVTGQGRAVSAAIGGAEAGTGAGDSVSAGAVLALAAHATHSEAALIGNLVASITVQQLNQTGTARPEQLLSQLELWHKQSL